MKVKLTEAHTVEINSAALGRVSVEFQAGDVTPKSEQEELALQVLIDQGLAVESSRKTPKAEEA